MPLGMNAVRRWGNPRRTRPLRQWFGPIPRRAGRGRQLPLSSAGIGRVAARTGPARWVDGEVARDVERVRRGSVAGAGTRSWAGGHGRPHRHRPGGVLPACPRWGGRALAPGPGAGLSRPGREQGSPRAPVRGRSLVTPNGPAGSARAEFSLPGRAGEHGSRARAGEQGSPRVPVRGRSPVTPNGPAGAAPRGRRSGSRRCHRRAVRGPWSVVRGFGRSVSERRPAGPGPRPRRDPRAGPDVPRNRPAGPAPRRTRRAGPGSHRTRCVDPWTR